MNTGTKTLLCILWPLSHIFLFALHYADADVPRCRNGALPESMSSQTYLKPVGRQNPAIFNVFKSDPLSLSMLSDCWGHGSFPVSIFGTL